MRLRPLAVALYSWRGWHYAGMRSSIWGCSFTVNVAIAADHPVVDSGPYRYVRHPSYSGALLAFVWAWGSATATWCRRCCWCVLPWLALGRRTLIEERALLGGLGEPYLRVTAPARNGPFLWLY